MSADRLPFELLDDAGLAARREDDGAVEVPAGIRDKGELLATLAERLGAPEWFGRNWDALEDGLRDLSWRDAPTILVHRDLPLDDDEERAVYLDVLRDAVDGWQDTPGTLAVAFPDGLRERLAELLGDAPPADTN